MNWITKTFSLEAKPTLVKEFVSEKGIKSVRMELTIFSKANNRNQAYFDITDLLLDDDTAKKLVFNFNHDQNDVLGGIMVNQMSNIRLDKGLNGYEIKATFVSSDTKLIERLESITGVSVEVRVNPDNVKVFSDGGEFYTQTDFSGMSFLTGVLAGSGDTRINEIQTYSNNNNIMQEEQIKELLEAQKAELQASFSAEIEALKKEFAEKEVEVIPETTPEEVVTPEVVEAPKETKNEEVTVPEDEQLQKTQEFMAKMKEIGNEELVFDDRKSDKGKTQVQAKIPSFWLKLNNK